MSYKVVNNPLLSFKLINGMLYVLSDSDSNDKSRKPILNIVPDYNKITAINISFSGFDLINVNDHGNSIDGQVKLHFEYKNGTKSEILIADQDIPLIQNSKFKRKTTVDFSQLVIASKKDIQKTWNNIFDDALSSLYELERSQALPGPSISTTAPYQPSFELINKTPKLQSFSQNSSVNPLYGFLTSALQTGWAKLVAGAILIFVLLQMVIAISSNAIDVKNKKMEGDVFNTISQTGNEDEAVKRVLKDMGIERNTDKNDLGCFVE